MERFKVFEKEQKVKEQIRHVETAQKNIEIARADLLKKQQDVEKMRMHREEWDKEMKAIEIQKEGIETDEMGSALHNRKSVQDKKAASHKNKKLP